ncbi:MAG: GNAT family N-acetyltransferase [Alphaproteobacteria bacterium]|nr:GNAT family N-acetyltransferase [Alphaproteobacteria bacterium]
MPALATAVPLQLSTSVTVREAKPDDAEAMLRMVQALAEYQGIRQRVSVTADDFRRDGFGPERKFEALIADRKGQPVGLALFQTFYESWEGATALQITDLFVDEAVRGTGVGFRLVREVGRVAKNRGCASLQLNVVHANPSRASFDRIGFVHQDDLLHYRLDAQGLRELAEIDR